MVSFDLATESNESFDVARILLDTCHLQYIQSWVHLFIDGIGYDIHAREVMEMANTKEGKQLENKDVVMDKFEPMEENTSQATPVIIPMMVGIHALHDVALDERLQDVAWGHCKKVGVHSEASGNVVEVVELTICLMKSLDDDRLTLEVLNDLGLLKSGPIVEKFEHISSGLLRIVLIDKKKRIMDH